MENETEDQIVYQECILREGRRYCTEIETPGEPVAAPIVEPAAAEVAGPGLFDWADPILADPAGWARANLLNMDVLLPLGLQLLAILGAMLLGAILAAPLRRLVRAGLARLPENVQAIIGEVGPKLVRPAITLGLFYIVQTVLVSSGMDATLVRVAFSLSVAFFLITLASRFLPESLRKPALYLALAIAGLNAFGVLDDVVAWSYTIGPPFGGRRINPPFILQAILTAGIFLYAANWLSKRLKTRVETLPKVEPSLRILLTNALQVGLFFAAAILTLAGLNIPLSGLAVLGGAIGVGLGFGMQQIVANFISGVILLTDRSIKPDDVIEVDETYGVVKSLGLRYASVITRDGKEHLIPNEQLITDRVINWSYSDKKVRIKRRLRVEYETDLKLACGLVVEGAKMTPRVLAEPAPKCLVMEFGEEAVEIEARFWIDDPQNGVSNVGSAVMLNVWDKFQEAGIDIPLRHEDVLITPGSTLKVEMVRPGKTKASAGEEE
ncbi:MAG: mechanosensitive ion channel [Hyphomonadaceae bacterium]|nr:mechanosensitive ion channel [Hyphomonadaceae bacterium]